ncbi:MAG: GAF domain-containing protein [Candidatus Zixiibacteriota bacterium]|nr:MAG: GAF domain-containing protein [candidate division Zixibacteria bacterium]
MVESRQERSLNEAALFEGLDRAEVGLFLLNREGYLVRYNSTAERILGIDSENDFGQLHISSLDAILSTGLAERVYDIAAGSAEFSRRNICCTNTQGRYLVLDVSCRPVSSPDGEPPLVMGVIQDSNSRREISCEKDNYTQDMHILSAVAAALSSSCALPEILNAILTGATASQGLGFNRAFLFLYDKQADRLHGHLAVGPSSPEEAGRIWQRLEEERKSLDELLDAEKSEAIETDSIAAMVRGMEFDLSEDSVIGRACRNGAWVNLEKVEDIDVRTGSFLDRLGTRNMALVPMVSKDTLMGLLAADCAITGRPISDESVELLQILANQAAVAMERAGLYEEQIERAEQLQQLNVLLGESQEHLIKIEKMSIIGELTAAIAHELRNPLTVIGGFANLMLKSPVTDEQREYLQIIAGETKRSESVLDHVLDFSKASRSDHAEIDFGQMVQKNLQTLHSRLRRGDLGISLSLAEQEMKVFGNHDQLSHAFYQFFKLVAEDVIPPGRAEIRTERKDDRAIMRIKIDVDESQRQQTIKALKQVLAENKTSHRLTILVAAETIKYHGGDFGVMTGDNRVPSIYVELPLMKESVNVVQNTGDR